MNIQNVSSSRLCNRLQSLNGLRDINSLKQAETLCSAGRHRSTATDHWLRPSGSRNDHASAALGAAKLCHLSLMYGLGRIGARGLRWRRTSVFSCGDFSCKPPRSRRANLTELHWTLEFWTRVGAFISRWNSRTGVRVMWTRLYK